MQSEKRVLIARYCFRKDSQPRMAALIPKKGAGPESNIDSILPGPFHHVCQVFSCCVWRVCQCVWLAPRTWSFRAHGLAVFALHGRHSTLGMEVLQSQSVLGASFGKLQLFKYIHMKMFWALFFPVPAQIVCFDAAQIAAKKGKIIRAEANGLVHLCRTGGRQVTTWVRKGLETTRHPDLFLEVACDGHMVSSMCKHHQGLMQDPSGEQKAFANALVDALTFPNERELLRRAKRWGWDQ